MITSGRFSVALYKGTRPGLQGFYSRAVRWIDRGPYSHCELVFSDGVCASASFIDGGVRFKEIDFKPGHWDFLRLPDDVALQINAKWWFINHVSQPYDLMGNLRFGIGLVRDSSDSWFCSESVMAALGFKEAYRYGPCGMAIVLQEHFNISIQST